MEKLYSNVGKVLQTLAVIVAMLLAIAGIIWGIVFLANGAGLMGVLLILVSPLAAYLSSLILYAFGELVENTKKIAENTASLQNQNTPVKEEELPEL